ncbi:GTP cyclohydrolase II RibA [Nocardia sp. ET3-3]|uniref:GTP cyclohydrolase II n=1 Tax=Nocardia terrae TaxID=2675851 RepID=A0A7K1V7D9_9NOCA|nr:GTP cyclohydrolase II [Nocardia terrae]MVU82457.1 GTP cyclohydrolase II RibA [Nocardia terrae]
MGLRAAVRLSSRIDPLRTREVRLRASSVLDIARAERKQADTPERCDTEHQFTRNGQNLTLRVVELEDGQGHVLIFGSERIPENCLVRIHSRCLYGDVLGSDDCDCGPELKLSMDLIQHEGRGVVIYLEQEGRGAGLVNKARAYRYSQDSGADTFESYHKLGLEPDIRRYLTAGAALKKQGLSKIRLLTNNPAKAEDLREVGLDVEMTPLWIAPRNQAVHRYLEAKRAHRDHRLPKSWNFYRWIDRSMQAVMLLAFGLCCAALALAARSAILIVWEHARPGTAIPAGVFVITAVGFAATMGLAAGKRDSLRRRLLKARVASRVARSQLR